MRRCWARLSAWSVFGMGAAAALACAAVTASPGFAASVKKADDTTVTGPLVALENGAVILDVDVDGRPQRTTLALEDVVEMVLDPAVDVPKPPTTAPTTAPAAATKPSAQTPPPVVPQRGFVSVFDGKSLSGWDGAGDVWSAKDGAIVGEITEKTISNRGAFLVLAAGEFGDFELQYRFRITGGLRNSAGVQFRSRVVDEDGQRDVLGYQQDLGIPAGLVGGIIDSGANAAGAVVKALPGSRVSYDAEGRATSTNLAKSADELSAAFKESDWNDAVIAVKGTHIASVINGELFAEVINIAPSSAKTGVIALQLSRRRVMTVQFRDIRLRRLHPEDKPAVPGLVLDGDVSKAAVVSATAAPAPAAGAASADAVAVPTKWQVRVAGGDHVGGDLVAWDDRTMTLNTAHGELAIPATALREVWRAGPDEIAKAREAARSAGAAATDDVAFARKDGQVIPVAGRASGMTDEGTALRFRFRDEDRTIAADRLVGVTLASAAADGDSVAAAPTDDPPEQSLQIRSGDVITGRWTALAAGALTLDVPWAGASVRVPINDIERVRTKNGRLVYLSDVKPAQVEQVPYFDRLMPFRGDRSLTGGPIRLTTGEYAKGLSVHSRTVLRYDVGGRFERLRAKVGFQQPEGKAGRATVRVLGDGGKLLHEIPDARGDQPPVDLDLPVTGVSQLTLEVDFGANQDVADRVVWAEARLIRAAKAK